MTTEQWPVFARGLIAGIALGVLLLGLHLVLARWRADRRSRRRRRTTLAELRRHPTRNGAARHG
jgi:hypothetical protein